MIKTEIVQDSINEFGDRITTYVLEYPRFVHAELMTHRMFSKNSASSRAIPFEKFVEQITINPAMPVFWGKNQSGMQAAEELDNTMMNCRESKFGDFPQYSTDRAYAQELWLQARDSAIAQATQLHKLGVHKQIVNRILEPWFHMRIILTSTDFGNFFALRCHKDAQPEIQALAYAMLDDYNKSTPKLLKSGEWHIPFGDNMNDDKIISIMDNYPSGHSVQKHKLNEIKRKIAIARCARVSYFNFEGKDDYEADIKLCDRLFSNTPKHLSPTEHVACAMDKSEYCGNFKGWKQYRKFFPDENLNDSRIIKKL